MPIFIEETARGYPDPVDSETQDVEFYGSGKGSYIVGKDEVFYIGDPETLVLTNTAQRNKIYRMYDGVARDHLYTNDEEEKPRSYNREPRNSLEYVFTLMKNNVNGSIPIYRLYNSTTKDTRLSTTSSASGYSNLGIIGYGFPSLAAANNYRNSKIAENAVPLYNYYSADATDSFVTLHPENEVNLQEYNSGPLGPPYPGDDRQNPDRGDQYTYQGILCWVFERVSGTDLKKVIEVGKPQYSGSAFLYGWLTDVNGGTALGETPTNWKMGRYSPFAQLFRINDNRANFTFLYGEFGPVKAALPRFLGYKFLYDSQFFYYLYNTSDPWNGPMFGVRLFTDKNSEGNCCITPPSGGGGGGGGGGSTCPTTDPWIRRYFYQPRPNTWKTKITRIYTDVTTDSGQDQNILTAGTNDRIVFFRYTAGSFNLVEGDTVNGWRITEHRYMGDELSTGFIRISPVTEGTDGGAFNYGSVYSSSNTQFPASFVALAGWGIPDRAAIFGVYEFRKKVSYYKVELHPDAAIPKRTMDEADITANIDNNGKVASLTIHNGGYGYSLNARVEILPPPNKNTQAEVEKTRNYYVDSDLATVNMDKFNYTKIGQNGDYSTIGSIVTSHLKESVVINETAVKIKPANCRVKRISEEGVIQEVEILDGGSGYTSQQPPQVIVYDPKVIEKSIKPEGNRKSANDSLINVLKGSGSTNEVNQLLSQSLQNPKLTSSITDAFNKFDGGIQGTVYTGYIKGVGDIDSNNTFKFCFGVPGSCAQPLFQTINPLSYYNSDLFKNIMTYDQTGGFRSAYTFLSTTGKDAFSNLQKTADDASGLYGGINKNGINSPQCITMQQPTLYSVNRFYDIPCPYTTGAGDSLRVFGWMPYQYAASKRESTTFNVYLEIDGDFTGPASSTAQNNALIAKLKSLQAPRILAPRPAAAGVKTWHCTRGSYEGRCFRAGDNDISFYPVGLDENVYDYTHLSVYDAYNVWIGQPPSTLTGSAGTRNGIYFYWLGFGLLTGTKYSGPNQPSTSWDFYVHNASTNPNGIFSKFTGYDADGNGVGNLSRWDNYIYTMPPCEGITDIDSMIAIDPTQIAQNNDLIRIGPIKGRVTVKNFSTGSAKVYADAVNNLGNPYFDICLNATN